MHCSLDGKFQKRNIYTSLVSFILVYFGRFVYTSTYLFTYVLYRNTCNKGHSQTCHLNKLFASENNRLSFHASCTIEIESYVYIFSNFFYNIDGFFIIMIQFDYIYNFKDMNTLYIWHEINQTAVKIKCINK